MPGQASALIGRLAPFPATSKGYERLEFGFHGERSEGFHALAVAVQSELPVSELRRYWQVNRAEEPEGPHWELTFSAPAAICSPRRGDGQPSQLSSALS